MTIDKDLLWKAYPAGYLAIQGVSTVEGWTCVCVLPDRAYFANEEDTLCCWFDASGEEWDAERNEGQFLPNVDPTDVATWACLLADLSRAMGQSAERGYLQSVPAWSMTTRITVGGTLFFVNEKPVELEVTTRDPAEALIRARIQVREETGR